MRRISRADRLGLLVLAISDRCDQRCAHCAIWSTAAPAATALTREERLAIVDEALAEGVRVALITGGEPLLSPDLWPIAERLKAGGARVLLATNGMLLASYASRVAACVDEVYVSLDGASATTHDRLRGVPALARVAAGVAALRRWPEVTVIARCTLHAGNLREFPDVVGQARRMGFQHVSFLALDATSEAFGGGPEARRALVPGAEAVGAFLRAVDRFEAEGGLRGGFVLESARKLKAIGAHLRASGGAAAFSRPACDAPWWSSVVEADGAVRPCFFHASVGDARGGLSRLRRSVAYETALARISGPNATCDRCVCPKRSAPTLLEKVFG